MVTPEQNIEPANATTTSVTGPCDKEGTAVAPPLGPVSPIADFKIRRSGDVTPQSAPRVVSGFNLPPFFELEPPLSAQSSPKKGLKRSYVAMPVDVRRWMIAVPASLEKAHKRTANSTKAARFEALQGAVYAALPNPAISAWIARYQGSHPDQLFRFLHECSGELRGISNLLTGSAARSERVEALREKLRTASVVQQLPVELPEDDPFFRIAERTFPQTAEVILAMLMWC